MVSQSTVNAVLVGLMVALAGAVLTAGGRAEWLSSRLAQAPFQPLPEPETEPQSPNVRQRIRQTNEALQSTLSTEADTDVANAFSADLAQPGGLISSVSENEMGGGNPDYGDVTADVGVDVGGSSPFGGSAGGGGYIGGSTTSTGF